MNHARKRARKLLKYRPHVSSTQSNTVLFGREIECKDYGFWIFWDCGEN